MAETTPTEASPLPWTFDGKTIKSGKYPVVDLEDICSRHGDEPGAIANAELIVAAVNATALARPTPLGESEAIAKEVCRELYAPGSRLSVFDAVVLALNRASPKCPTPGLPDKLRKAIVDIVDSTRGGSGRRIPGGTECRLCEAWDEYLAAKCPTPGEAQRRPFSRFFEPEVEAEYSHALAKIEEECQLSDPRDEHKIWCLFCAKDKPGHEDDCPFAMLRAALSGQQAGWSTTLSDIDNHWVSEWSKVRKAWRDPYNSATNAIRSWSKAEIENCLFMPLVSKPDAPSLPAPPAEGSGG